MSVDVVMFCRLPKPRGGLALEPLAMARFHSLGRGNVAFTPGSPVGSKRNAEGAAAGPGGPEGPGAGVGAVTGTGAGAGAGAGPGAGAGAGTGAGAGPSPAEASLAQALAPPPSRHPAPDPRTLYLIVTVEDQVRYQILSSPYLAPIYPLPSPCLAPV